MEEILTLKNIIMYMLAINLITFLAMGIDKWKAKNGYWRTKEKTLITMAFLGGSIGGMAGIYLFRHKTKKPQFYIGFPLILVIELVCIIFFIITN